MAPKPADSLLRTQQQQTHLQHPHTQHQPQQWAWHNPLAQLLDESDREEDPISTSTASLFPSFPGSRIGFRQNPLGSLGAMSDMHMHMQTESSSSLADHGLSLLGSGHRPAPTYIKDIKEDTLDDLFSFSMLSTGALGSRRVHSAADVAFDELDHEMNLIPADLFGH